MILKITTATLFLMTLMATQITYANDKIEMGALCQKMEQCSIQEMQAEEAPEEMIQFMQSMFSNQCAAAGELYGAATKHTGLLDKAQACVDSRVQLKCSVLLGDSKTPECDAFEAAADDLGKKYE